MTDQSTQNQLIEWAAKYNDPLYFSEDPIIFPKHFAALLPGGGARLEDVEIAAVVAAHLAWGRRSMIVRDCGRAMDEMGWRPYDYVMNGEYRDDGSSLHRTVKWSEFAGICSALRRFYGGGGQTLENLSVQEIRTRIYGRREDPGAADKKINMLRRWMVRNDGKVDLGVWKNSPPAGLVIPLDVHVYEEAVALGLTARKQKNLATALDITSALGEIFPGDPCLGDFALFGYGVSK